MYIILGIIYARHLFITILSLPVVLLTRPYISHYREVATQTGSTRARRVTEEESVCGYCE